MRFPSNNHARHRAFTLVEMLIVVVIVGIMSVAITAEMHGTFQDELLRATSRDLASAFNLASSRAISVNRPYRIRIDRFKHRYFLERSRRGGKEFFAARDTASGTGKLDPRIAIELMEPGINAPDDAGRPAADSAPEQPSASVGFPQDAVTFYPDGTADRCELELTDKDGYKLAMRVNPVTSRIQVKALGHQP
jgi:type II secretion system protein H